MKSDHSNEYTSRVEQLREELVKAIVGSEYERNFFYNTRGNSVANFIESLDELLDLYVAGRIDLSDNQDLAKTFDKLLPICDARKLSELQSIQTEMATEDLAGFHQSMVGFKEKIQNGTFYKQSHVDTITDFSKMSDEELEQDGIDIESRDGVKVYTLKGIPFQMFVHKGSYDTNSGTHGADKLSVSMVSDKMNLKTIGAEESRRLLVFNTITANDIIEMGTQDLGQGYERQEDVLREQRMMADEFLNNVPSVRGKDYTDYSVHTLYTNSGEMKPEGKLQPDAIFVRGEILPEDIEYAKSRGITNIYSYQKERYEQREPVDNVEFEKALAEYTETLNPSLLVPLRAKTSMSSEKFAETIQQILLNSKQREGVNARLISVNARTLSNMFNYERKKKTELQSQIDALEQLKEKPMIELEAGSEEEKRFLQEKQKEAEQQRVEEKKEIIARLKAGIDAKDGEQIANAMSDFLNTSINIEEDFAYVINFVQNNTELIRQTQCYANIMRMASGTLEIQGWREQGNEAFESYIKFCQMYRDVENPTSNLENIDACFGIISEQSSVKTDVLASAIEATEEVARTSTINDQVQNIKNIQRERTQQDKTNNGIDR